MEQKKSTKYILIAISVLFIFVMLILPLFSILFSALKEGKQGKNQHNKYEKNADGY